MSVRASSDHKAHKADGLLSGGEAPCAVDVCRDSHRSVGSPSSFWMIAALPLWPARSKF